MIDEHNAVSLLARALDQVRDRVSAVRPEQSVLPTPCRSWDVRSLVNHLVHDAIQFEAMARGASYEKRDDDVLGDDWNAAMAAAADSLLATWRRPGALDGTVKLPWGELPVTWKVGQQIVEFTIHSWDLANATDQAAPLDPELAEVSLEWGRENLKPEFRADEESGGAFGFEILMPADAAAYDLLAGFFGRVPLPAA